MPRAPGTILHAPVKAGHDLALVNQPGHLPGQVFRLPAGQALGIQGLSHRLFGVVRAEIGIADGGSNASGPTVVKGRAGATPTVPHIRVDEDPADPLDLENALIELYVGGHAAREHHGVDAGLLDPVTDVSGGQVFKHELIGRSHVDLGKLGGQIAGK